MPQENDYMQFSITKAELLASSIYVKDKDNDIEDYGIDEGVARIHSLAEDPSGFHLDTGQRSDKFPSHLTYCFWNEVKTTAGWLPVVYNFPM